MSLKDLALKTIESGGWTFEDLAPRFRSALIRRIGNAQDGQFNNFESRSLMELTLLAYHSNIPRTWQGFGVNSKFLMPSCEPQSFAVASELAEKVSPGGTPTALTSEDISLIVRAERFLFDAAPSTFTLKDRWVNSYMKLQNVGFRSGSHPHAFGCIFFGERIREFTEMEVAVSIVHEMAHQELFLFNLLDRLVESDADFKLVHAPFQGMVRPTIGRLHSLYALYRMVEFERQAGINSDRHADILFATADTFAPGDLTDYGGRLVETVVRRTRLNKNLRNAVSL
ncbi:MAG: HEXXH motif-containing putative peptide modification protein [Bdellovibrionales bacterium]